MSRLKRLGDFKGQIAINEAVTDTSLNSLVSTVKSAQVKAGMVAGHLKDSNLKSASSEVTDAFGHLGQALEALERAQDIIAKNQGAKVDEGFEGMAISDSERSAVNGAKQDIRSAREKIETAKDKASDSKKRPGLYDRAIAAVNQANELLEQARSSSGR